MQYREVFVFVVLVHAMLNYKQQVLLMQIHDHQLAHDVGVLQQDHAHKIALDLCTGTLMQVHIVPIFRHLLVWREYDV